MSSARCLAVAFVVAVAVSGCEQQAPPPPAASRLAPDLMREARAAMARNEYQTSATLLRTVLAADAGNLEAHYRLAVSASYLDLADEAVREFEWVVAHGGSSSEEVKLARQWLAQSRAATPRPDKEESSEPPAPDRASLVGRVIGDDGTGPKPMARFRLFLKGVSFDAYQFLSTDDDGKYRAKNLLPGDYMLTNRVAGPAIWRLKVTVKAGEELALDLTPDNTVKTRDDFPGAGK